MSPSVSALLRKLTRPSDRADTMTVLSSPFIWIHCLCYMSVFCAKTSAVDWGQLYLMDDHKHSQYVGKVAEAGGGLRL